MCWNNWWDMYNQQYMEYCIGVSELNIGDLHGFSSAYGSFNGEKDRLSTIIIFIFSDNPNLTKLSCGLTMEYQGTIGDWNNLSWVKHDRFQRSNQKTWDFQCFISGLMERLGHFYLNQIMINAHRLEMDNGWVMRWVIRWVVKAQLEGTFGDNKDQRWPAVLVLVKHWTVKLL